MSQLVSEFAVDDHVPFIATKARAAVPSSPSANTAMRLLLTGFKTSDGTMTADTVVGPVTSEEQAAELAGTASELARAYRAGRAQSKDLEMWFGCVSEPSGTEAFARFTIGGSWSTAGEIVIYVDGDPLFVTVGASDATTAVATAVETRAALYPNLSYTANADSSSVDLTKANKGTRGNSSILYVDTTNAPSGLTVTLEPPLGALILDAPEQSHRRNQQASDQPQKGPCRVGYAECADHAHDNAMRGPSGMYSTATPPMPLDSTW